MAKTKVSRGTQNLELGYKPLPKQSEAHALKAKYRGFCGGWGNGKTSWGCVETFIRLMEYPGTRAIVARKTRPELKSTSWDMLLNGDPGHPHAWTGIPQEAIASYNKSDLVIELVNKSIIFGLPLDDPKKIENYNLGFFWIDQAEEIEEEIFLKFHGRLRQKVGPREGILTFNPAGHNWLWKRFFDPMRPIRWVPQYKSVEATTYDNPTLPDDYIDQFVGLPDVWIQRFLMGSHEVFVGQIFTDWDPETHIVQPFRIPYEWPRWCCIDPGIRHEAAVSWVAQDFVGNVYYYRERLEANQDVSWWSDLIFECEARDDWGGPNEQIFRRLIGPEARQRGQTDGKSVLDVFNEYGVYPETADRSPAARISEVTAHLRPKTDHRNPWTGSHPAPRLYVFADCDKLIEYLPQYRWKPQRVNYAEEDLPEEVRKKDDHNIDNLGHILVAIDQVPDPVVTRPRAKSMEHRVLQELEEAAYEEAERDGEAYHSLLGRV
jgi:hypothetical protein